VQQLALNPQQLAGQCSKLKCCLNYEYDVYVDAMKEFPDTRTVLKTKKGIGLHQKTEVFKRIMWYAYEGDEFNMIDLPLEQVKEIISMNARGKQPERLEDFVKNKETKSDFENAADQFELGRFDKKK
jgi:hypothetical protein